MVQLSNFEITLATSDSEKIKVMSEIICCKSNLINNMINDLINEDTTYIELPMSSIDSKTMNRVIEWCDHYKDKEFPADEDDDYYFKSIDEMTDWETNFTKDLQDNELADLMNSVNFLDIKPLLHLCAQEFAKRIKHLDADGIREYFNLPKPEPESVPTEQVKAEVEVETSGN